MIARSGGINRYAAPKRQNQQQNSREYDSAFDRNDFLRVPYGTW